MNLENICVQKTMEYGIIKHIVGNRLVNPSHVETLKMSMSEKLLIIPAIVNEKMQVIDGQHRLQACIELALPFYYVIVEGYGLEDVQRMNTNMKNWTTSDFMQTYLDLYKAGHSEYVSYVRLNEFINKYNIPLNAAITISDFSKTDGVKDTSFKHGSFLFNDTHANSAGLFIEEVIEIFSGLHDKKWFGVSFLKAYADFYHFHDYDSSTMIKKQGVIATGTKQSLPFHDVSGTAGYRNMILEAYNHATIRNKRLNINDVKFVISDMQKGK